MKKHTKWISLVLTFAMLAGLMPTFALPAKAASSNAGKWLEAYCGAGQIGNGQKSASDLFMNFQNGTPGFSKSQNGDVKVSGNTVSVGTPGNDWMVFRVDLQNNEQMKLLAQSPTAKYRVYGKVKSGEKDFHWGETHNDCDCGKIVCSDSKQGTFFNLSSPFDGSSDYDTGWKSLTGLTYIELKACSDICCDSHDNNNADGDSYVEIYMEVQDTGTPSMTYTTDFRNVNVNPDNSKELLVKLPVRDEDDPDHRYDADNLLEGYIGINLSFSVPVKPDETTCLYSHTLFTNTLGTGYVGSGELRGLKIVDANALNQFSKAISYRYTVSRGDFNGNNKIAAGGGIESTSGYSYPDANGSVTSLLDKINRAGFHDVAGNPVVVNGSAGKNIFDRNDGGYDVIVDAEPPTYTRTGNGITPDILTKVVLNENDSVDFIVSFSEATITKRSYDNTKTYLLLNNGDRAYFRSKSKDGKQWIFHYELKDAETEVETVQWQVIGLCNDALDGALADEAGSPDTRKNIAKHSLNADGRTITDYVGNIMADRANEDALTNDKQIESSIAWAQLSVDNTAPEISFTYNRYNAALTRPTEDSETDGKAGQWGQAGKIYVSAIDPEIDTPKYDPDQSESSRPSSGIFRPDNASAAAESTSTAKGLFFYIWSPDETPPDAGENFEVIKRYSLAGWDSAALAEMENPDSPYASWKELFDRGLKLTAANNYAEIVPPEQILEPENSGTWYLHVWTADMSWDSARQLIQYELMYGLKFQQNTDTGKPYTTAEALAVKMSMMEQDFSQKVQSNPAYSYDNAWDAVKAAYQSTVYTEQYRTWLAESGKDVYSDDAELYARNQAMKTVGDYGDTEVWPPELFRSKDSNWTQKSAEVRFDNALPTAAADFAAAKGSGTRSVELPFSAEDAHAGIDTEQVYYQWVRKPDGADETRPEAAKELQEINWIPVSPDSGETGVFTAVTDGHVDEDGDYYLSVKVTDLAGNEAVYHFEETITVYSAVGAVCDFAETEEAADFYRSVTPTFRVHEVKIAEVRCAVTDSALRPAEEDFAVIESCGQADTGFDRFYQLNTLGADKADGAWYVHVLILEDTPNASEPYYFYQAYKLDNTAPTLYLNPEAGGLEKAENSVTVTAADELSGIDEAALYYQWTKSASAPAEDAAGWLHLTPGGAAVKTITDPADNGDYYLHVRVRDKAGNSAAKTSQAFPFKAAELETVGDYESRLIALYEEDGSVYGIAELVLNVEDKAGYRYSFSSDSGKSWSSWMPYSSMARLLLPIGGTDQTETLEGMLAVKFRAPGGTVGEVKPVSLEGLNPENSLWAVMTAESGIARQSGKPLALLVSAPDGVTVEASADNALPVIQDAEGDFTVSGNGLYRFTLTDGSGEKSFAIVVDLYDDEAPRGVVTYSDTAPTKANVVARLEADESVYVQKIQILDEQGAVTANRSGSTAYTFTDNGSVRFVFRDAAGNESTAVATVSNIDRSGPDVEILVQYADGKGKSYATVSDGTNTLSRGLFLTLGKVKGGNGKDFTVVSGDRSGMLEVTENGTYSFTVQDAMGNICVISRTVTEIVGEIPEPSVSYRFTSEENAGLIPGESFKNDSVVVTISIPDPGDGRKLYLGKQSNPNASPLELIGGCYVLEHTLRVNGETGIWFNDGLGGNVLVPITVTGIDREKPTLTLNRETAVLKLEDGEVLSGQELITALGGYTAFDRESPAELSVTVCDTDEERSPLSFTNTRPGVYTVRYYITDGAKNENYVDQTVYVISANDMLVKADNALLVNGGSNTAILASNRVYFTVSQNELQQMFYRGSRAYNRSMRYDVYYTTGLYREGQMKYIAEKLTGEELVSMAYQITFEKTGWYTIVIRNQERSRIYTSFFISSITN